MSIPSLIALATVLGLGSFGGDDPPPPSVTQTETKVASSFVLGEGSARQEF